MRPPVFALCLLVPLAAGCGSKAPTTFSAVAKAIDLTPDPTPFASKAGDFSVTFPHRPKVERSGPDDPREKDFEEIANVFSGGNEYFATTATFAEKAKQIDPQKIMLGARDGGFKVHKAKAVGDEETTFGPHKLPARTATGEAPDGRRVRFLIVMAGNRLYSVGVVGRPDFVTGPEAEKFLSSLTVTPAGTNPAGLPPVTPR